MLGRITFWISIYSILAIQFVVGCASPTASNSPTETFEVSNQSPATVEIAAPEEAYAPGGQNAVSSSAGETYEYDQNGNLVEHEVDSYVATYEYDVNLRIESQEVRHRDQNPGSGQKAKFIYDADGNKIATLEPFEDQIHTDPAVRLVQKTGAPATYRMKYGHSETNEDGDPEYFVKDHLGSILAVATSDSFAEVKDTTPFGGVWYHKEFRTDNSDFSFNGNQEEGIEHDGVRLLDYNARHMAQNAGRFLQADTIIPNPNAPIGYNRYAYVDNNPVNMIDPTGHYAEWQKDSSSHGKWIGSQSGVDHGYGYEASQRRKAAADEPYVNTSGIERRFQANLAQGGNDYLAEKDAQSKVASNSAVASLQNTKNAIAPWSDDMPMPNGGVIDNPSPYANPSATRPPAYRTTKQKLVGFGAFMMVFVPHAVALAGSPYVQRPMTMGNMNGRLEVASKHEIPLLRYSETARGPRLVHATLRDASGNVLSEITHLGVTPGNNGVMLSPHGVYTPPSLRGRGYGSRLIDLAAKHHNATSISLPPTLMQGTNRPASYAMSDILRMPSPKAFVRAGYSNVRSVDGRYLLFTKPGP